MPLLLKPTLACNFRCDYCYQTDYRQGHPDTVYDLDRIESKARSLQKQSITLHGGEITLLPLEDLKRLLKLAYELQGQTSIQTNGYALTEEHFRLFQDYKTSVGVSVDGPWPLNRYRGIGSEDDRRRQTEQVLANINRLRALGINVSVISVITDLHVADPDRYAAWIIDLKAKGITSGRMNYVQTTAGFGAADVTEEDMTGFYLKMADIVLADPDLKWQPFRDTVDNLLGLGLGTCTFTKCDPYCTDAAHVISGDGTGYPCLRSMQGDDVLIRAESISLERYELLAQTSEEDGGCKGCRYWKVCYGFCPACAIQGDWRNRAEFCGVWKALYANVEVRLKGLMPNIRLVTDEAGEDYDLRSSAKTGPRTFAAMLPDNGRRPSSWQAGCRQQAQAEGTIQKVEDGCGYSDAHGYLVDLGDGRHHADHADAALLRGDRG